jgi:S-adenosylmethionine decarboxylase
MWGKSLLIDFYDADHNKIINYSNISNFSKELVERIDMVAFGEPFIAHFGSGEKEGYTLVQLIETSNITAHFANDSNSIFLDVFSCKDFHENEIIKCLIKYFGRELAIKNYNIHSKTIIRGTQLL